MTDPGKIRNIALVGHRGTGKTSLFEGLLYSAGAVSRLGSVADGTSVSNWDEDEKKRRMSLSASMAHVERNGLDFNIIDTPGDWSFLADAIASLEVVETAVMVVNAVLGVEVQTERLWARAEARGLGRVLYCNMLDRERADFDAAVEELRDAFGSQVVAVHMPIGKEQDFRGMIDLLEMRAYTHEDGKLQIGEIPAELREEAEAARELLVDTVASTDDDLAEKYLLEEEITVEELDAAFASAVARAEIFPVTCGAATSCIGVVGLFDLLALMPSPVDMPTPKLIAAEGAEGTDVELMCDPEQPVVAFVFKTLADQFSGHVNVFRVMQGTLSSDSQIVVSRDGHKERVGQLLRLLGKDHTPTDVLVAGDIGAVAKFKDVVTGDTICASPNCGSLPAIEFPAPLMSFAIRAKSKGEEDKVITALRRLSEEDPSLEVHRDEQTGETIIGGMSQVHVEVTVERMRRRFGVEVELRPPRVPYRETIKGSAEAEGKHKKQTGGRGQFADTWIRVSPQPRGEGFEFVDKIVGGAVPRNFIPAVEKGVRTAMAEGFLAGYPVVDVRVELYDGKFHPVDSSDMAFQIAGSIGFKAAAEKAQPVLLEPIMSVEITIPDENVGDILGDINSRRGRVLGTEPRGRNTVVQTEVPMVEMLTYAPDLTSMTGGRGDYHMEVLRYDEVPAHLVQKIVEKAAAEKEEGS